ncbi:MAG: hypothetical protein ACOX41_07480 [Anaerovoracaceae bacterium]
MNEKKKRNCKKAGLLLLAVLCCTFLLCACGAEKSLHLHYADQKDSPYGTGNYLYSTVTFGGSGLGRETVLSVRQMEQRVLDQKKEAYTGKYSLLTRGSIFSRHTYTGLNLYQLLRSLGMDKEIAAGTPVTVLSADGYQKTFTVAELKKSGRGYYSSKSASSPKKNDIPIILAFGSDGRPLVGPTGSQKVGTEMTKKDGYDEDAENEGGPVRLTLGQRTAGEFNAPDNAKWVTAVIVGKRRSYTRHRGSAAKKTLRLSVYDADHGNRRESDRQISTGAVERFAAARDGNLCASYYGGSHYFEGADLWRWLRDNARLGSRSGKVVFRFDDGSAETVDLDYLRNADGSDDSYYTVKDGSRITSVMPALGYAVDGAPSEGGSLYALLPAKKDVRKKTTAKKLRSVAVYAAQSMEASANAEKTVTIDGGVDKKTTYTVADLENMPDLQQESGSFRGVNLYRLLEETGLRVDADRVVVRGGSRSVTIPLDKMKHSRCILAVRRAGKGLRGSYGSLSVEGRWECRDVRRLTVKTYQGQWKHSSGVYRRYQKQQIRLTGTALKKTATLTVADLEKRPAVRQSFAASAGTDGFQGVVLRDLLRDYLKDKGRRPSKIVVAGRDGYEREISVDSVYRGIDSRYQSGAHRDIILAYSINGTPLVPTKKSPGCKADNQFGPVRLVVENSVSYWVKNVSEIRISR